MKTIHFLTIDFADGRPTTAVFVKITDLYAHALLLHRRGAILKATTITY